MDATKNDEMAKKYDVTGYPTLFMFRAKTKDGEVSVKSSSYSGPREHHGIVRYLTDQAGEAAKPVKTLRELKAK